MLLLTILKGTFMCVATRATAKSIDNGIANGAASMVDGIIPN